MEGPAAGSGNLNRMVEYAESGVLSAAGAASRKRGGSDVLKDLFKSVV
jgi:hypothetical protein